MTSLNSSLTNKFNLIDQTSGNSLTISTICVGSAISTSQIWVGVTLPFVTKNTNYTITSLYVSLANKGDVSSLSVVDSKRNNGFAIAIKDITSFTFSSYQSFFAFLTYTITFA